MAFRQKLSKPLVVEPMQDHTHTVVFLHRFAESTPDEELPTKVLSSKQTKNHKTLGEQFPGVRWVFPFCKTGARPYGNLTADDRAAVGLVATNRSPYITQVLQQEAKRAGGLDRVVLGGQGETAAAGHEAMTSFPEISATVRGNLEDVTKFLRDNFYAPSWTDLTTHPRLAGFVGMHNEDREVTRDVASHGVAAKTTNDPPRVNISIVVNTPHCFIHGGYKVQTATWDGRRIDEFADFLADKLGVYRVVDHPTVPLGSNETLTPRDRHKQAEEKKQELNDAQQYALGLAKDKKENDALADIIKRRIEADKVERKIRRERQLQARRDSAVQKPSSPGEGINGDAGVSHKRGSPLYAMNMDDDDNDGDGGGEYESEQALKRHRKRQPGRPAAGGVAWETPSKVRGEMSEAQMRAFGLITEDQAVAEKGDLRVDASGSVLKGDEEVARKYP